MKNFTTCNMEQKNQFYKLLDDHISKLNKNKKSKFVIDQETYDKVLSALLLPKGSKCPDSNFNWGQNYTLPSLELVWPNSELVWPRSKSLIIYHG